MEGQQKSIVQEVVVVVPLSTRLAVPDVSVQHSEGCWFAWLACNNFVQQPHIAASPRLDCNPELDNVARRQLLDTQ